jgi:hypothetical protein
MASFSWNTLLLGLYALTNIFSLHGVNSIPIETVTGDGLSGHNGQDTLGAVACESSVCSEAGTKMLKMGGSAADAVSSTTTLEE